MLQVLKYKHLPARAHDSHSHVRARAYVRTCVRAHVRTCVHVRAHARTHSHAVLPFRTVPPHPVSALYILPSEPLATYTSLYPNLTPTSPQLHPTPPHPTPLPVFSPVSGTTTPTSTRRPCSKSKSKSKRKRKRKSKRKRKRKSKCTAAGKGTHRNMDLTTREGMMGAYLAALLGSKRRW